MMSNYPIKFNEDFYWYYIPASPYKYKILKFQPLRVIVLLVDELHYKETEVKFHFKHPITFDRFKRVINEKYSYYQHLIEFSEL